MDGNAKKKALLMIPYGLYVLGAADGGNQTVATVNWVTQTAFQPPLVVVGIKKDSGGACDGQGVEKSSRSPPWRPDRRLSRTSYFKHVEPEGWKVRQLRLRIGQERMSDHQRCARGGRVWWSGFYELGDHSTVVGRVTEGHLKREAPQIMMLKETGFNYGG